MKRRLGTHSNRSPAIPLLQSVSAVLQTILLRTPMKVNREIAIVIFSLLTLCASQSTRVEKLVDGIIVYPINAGQSKQVKVQVISENIIHVTAAAVDTFSAEKSLITVEHSDFTDWKYREEKDKAIVSTSSLQAEVIFESGEVLFKDANGKILLQEKQGGGKVFTKNSDNTFSISQAFESPEDEAFYGLGGHQNGQMNYKGEDVELVQHNIVDVVPFVYSNKNYGILWDNYSISYFGDARTYQPLSTLQLFDQSGKQGGLTAQYFVKEKVVRTVTEDEINFEYLETPQVDNFPKDVAQQGKVVWEGSFSSPKAGDHKFLFYSSGYIKVWIDGKLTLDKWRQNWNPWTNKFTVGVKSNEKHKIKIEWICDGGYLAVKHLDPLDEVQQKRLTLTSEIGDEINYYFIKGDNADDVIHGYRTLTGKAPIVPKWALGFWQSRERYTSQQQLIDVVREYRKRQIPLDNIVLDWQYWEDPKWGSHEFDKKRFPDPEGMVKELHANLHTNLMISVWPKFNKGTAHYDEMNKNGFLFTRNIEKQRKDWVGVGYESTFYDPFNPEAGKLFWQQIDSKLNRLGMDAWWLDATEPDMHSNLSLEERKLNMSPTAIGPGAKYFNAYSLVNSKSVYEGQRKSSPEKRVFILTRSAFAGQQRYGATTWSGDIVSRWSDLKDQIATGINFSLSGIPYWTMDIGGFAVEQRYYNATGETLDEWRELNTRWFQFGTFCPIFRSHGQFPFREIYNIAPEGHPVYNTLVYYDKLRYRLLPYIYSLAGHAFLNDYTIMRGLVMDFPKDPAVNEIADQYMFGPSLLINPVTEFKSTSRQVYLPKSAGWFDFYTGKYFAGGQSIKAEAPTERIPVYVKAGSIIPTGPEMQYTSEKPADPLTIFVYAGADGSFTLYEDEGANYNYEQGKYSLIPFSYNNATKTVTVGKRRGEFDGMLKNRTMNFSLVWEDNPAGMSTSTHPAKVINYTGEEVTISFSK
jgi:alpha-D-xyloside xylohydrolase